MQNSTANSSLHSAPHSAPHSATATASPHQATERAALAHAYERARERVLAGYPLTTDWLSLFTGPADEFADEKTMPYGAAAPDAVGAPGPGVRLTLDELLPVFREPIEWALSRAGHEAQGDPADLAAIARVRAAYQRRLAWIGRSGALGQPHPDVRPTDILIVVGLLARSIDPSLAQRAAAGLRASVRDVLTAMPQLIEAHAPRAMEASRPVTTLWLGLDDVLTLFGSPRVGHPSAPAFCRHGHPL